MDKGEALSLNLLILFQLLKVLKPLSNLLEEVLLMIAT